MVDFERIESALSGTAEKYEKCGKKIILGVATSTAAFAAVDQALQGEPFYVEALAESSWLIDRIGHGALGTAGSVATEETYSKISDNPDDGLAKYSWMLAGSIAAGGAGQASQYVIPGTPEFFYPVGESIAGGVASVAGQGVADYMEKRDYKSE
nr:MAG: hypothetical protein J07AB56_10960 [Candidatus Nanosalinarum sp. J07AB56]